MDIRSTETVVPEGNHQDTAPTWWLVPPGSMKEITQGGHLEHVAEFTVTGGGRIHSHRHPTHEFYYVIEGEGEMTIGDETRPIKVGDLVRIPPDEFHSLYASDPAVEVRCLAFAVATPGAGAVDYISE
jgi:mannose-6-phosphate isomerase-like protein (cupin superfamily)